VASTQALARLSPHLIGDEGGLQLRVWPFGATVLECWVPIGSSRRQVVLRHQDLSSYPSADGYLGATIGRVANRISGAPLMLNAEVMCLTANEGANHLHGGRRGFHHQLWDVVSVTSCAAEYGRVSPAGEEGYPGNLSARVRYQVFDNSVTITFWGESDRLTWFSPTNHAYFNLDGFATQHCVDRGISDHRLTINADCFTPTDDSLIPTGRTTGVGGTPLDFRDGRRVGDHFGQSARSGLARGLDHNFVIRGSGHREAARLVSSEGDLELVICSDRPGLQVYSGEHLAGVGVTPGGFPMMAGCGIALEPQHFPDAPHHLGFPSIELEPGTTWISQLEWRFQCLQ
jgi:aldose 1-epimerase